MNIPQAKAPFVRAPRRSFGFSVVEILVAVSIMTMIVFGLYKMFDQTQRALRSNITQSDVLESGRSAIDLLSREMEQMTASRMTAGTNFITRLAALPEVPLVQSISATGEERTNLLNDVFFITRQGNKTSAVGYRVLNATNGVGTLGRFSFTLHTSLVNPTNLVRAFVNAAPTNFQRIADGVVHFKVTPYDAQGRRVQFNLEINRLYSVPEPRVPTEFAIAYVNQTMPSQVELELGYLEPPVADQAKSLPNRDAARRFLEKQAGKIHLFRHRIPIRTSSQTQ